MGFGFGAFVVSDFHLRILTFSWRVALICLIVCMNESLLFSRCPGFEIEKYVEKRCFGQSVIHSFHRWSKKKCFVKWGERGRLNASYFHPNTFFLRFWNSQTYPIDYWIIFVSKIFIKYWYFQINLGIS